MFVAVEVEDVALVLACADNVGFHKRQGQYLFEVLEHSQFVLHWEFLSHHSVLSGFVDRVGVYVLLNIEFVADYLRVVVMPSVLEHRGVVEFLDL